MSLPKFTVKVYFNVHFEILIIIKCRKSAFILGEIDSSQRKEGVMVGGVYMSVQVFLFFLAALEEYGSFLETPQPPKPLQSYS